MISDYDLYRICLHDKVEIEKELKHYKKVIKNNKCHPVGIERSKLQIKYLEQDLLDINNTIRELKTKLSIE